MPLPFVLESAASLLRLLLDIDVSHAICTFRLVLYSTIEIVVDKNESGAGLRFFLT